MNFTPLPKLLTARDTLMIQPSVDLVTLRKCLSSFVKQHEKVTLDFGKANEIYFYYVLTWSQKEIFEIWGLDPENIAEDKDLILHIIAIFYKVYLGSSSPIVSFHPLRLLKTIYINSFPDELQMIAQRNKLCRYYRDNNKHWCYGTVNAYKVGRKTIHLCDGHILWLIGRRKFLPVETYRTVVE